MQDKLKTETTQIRQEVERIQTDFDLKYQEYLDNYSRENTNAETNWELNAIKKKIEIEKKKIIQNEAQIQVIEKSINKNREEFTHSLKKSKQVMHPEVINLEKVLKPEAVDNRNMEGFVWSPKTERVLGEVLDEVDYDFGKAVATLGERLGIGRAWTEAELRQKWLEIYTKRESTSGHPQEKENDMEQLD